MKKIILLLLVIPFFAFNTLQTESSFVGKWKGEDKGDIGVIDLTADGYATFEMNGEVLGGPEFLMEGVRMKMTYTINTNTTPMQLDFTMTKLSTDESRTMPGIVRFESDNAMRLAMNFNDTRANEFTEDNSILLNRVK